MSKPGAEGTKFLDIYDDAELRGIYAQMFPTFNFDADCWFVFAEVGGRRLLIDGSLSIAMHLNDERAKMWPFYSNKAEKRVRAAQEKCTFRKREFITATDTKATPAHPDYPVTIGVTGKEPKPQA